MLILLMYNSPYIRIFFTDSQQLLIPISTALLQGDGKVKEKNLSIIVSTPCGDGKGCVASIDMEEKGDDLLPFLRQSFLGFLLGTRWLSTVRRSRTRIKRE